MDRFESLGPVGEGSYGTVLKCRHRDSGHLVAIKKFMDSDDDRTVKKIALREIKLLRQLRHDNLVNLLEVWRRRHRWYLVFEFVDRTLLDDLEQKPNGLDLDTGRQYLFQILRAADFCHQQNVIHRDIKPENILISQEGVVKLCDFGFARTIASPSDAGVYTDYVATRWYRAPELLVGDIKYGKPVDVWAVGCLLMEMLTGQPLFPGESDLDQIYHIIRCFGNLTTHHQEVFYRNPVFSGVKLPECSSAVPLQQRFPTVTPTALDLAMRCLEMDPEGRAQCSELLEHPLFTQDSFHIRFLDELCAKIQKENRENSTLPKITKTPRREKDEEDQRSCKGKEKKISKEQVYKSKGKQPPKVSKTNCGTSEPLLAKQCKTSCHKATHNSAQSSMAVKRKPGKTTGPELRKDSEDKPTKTSESLKSHKPKHETSVPPQLSKELLKNVKDVNRSESDAEVNLMKIRRLSKSEPSREFAKTWSNVDSKVNKLSKSSITHSQNVNSSPKAILQSALDQKNTNLALQCCQLSGSSDVPHLTKSCKKIAASESQRADAQQRSSECPKVLALSFKTPKTTSNSGPKTSKNSSVLSCPSKTLPSGLSEHPSTVFVGSIPAQASKTCYTSKRREDGSNEKTAADLVLMSHASGADPESTKISSAFMTNKDKSILAVSDKDSQEDSTVPATKLFINQALKVSGRSDEDRRNNSFDFESHLLKSLKIPHPKQKLMEPECFSNHGTSRFIPETKTKSETTDQDVSTAEGLTSVTSANQKASIRSFVLQRINTTDLSQSDFNLPGSTTPPPPPSTPLLLPPSSTSAVSSVVGADDDLTDRAGLRPGSRCIGYVDTPRHHTIPNGRQGQQLSHITASLTFKAPENCLFGEHSLMSDRGNRGNSGSIAGVQNKPHVYFPDLRVQALPELKDRHNKSTTEGQKKEHLLPFGPPSEPHRPDSDMCTPNQAQ